MAWQTPKTNWTSSDSYNYTDLNRVENNISEAKAYLGSIGYSVPTITVITNRTNSSYDLLSSINRIENNIDQLRLSFIAPPNWLDKQVWTKATVFNESHANRWENNVALIYQYTQLVYQSFRYAGTFNAGQEVLG